MRHQNPQTENHSSLSSVFTDNSINQRNIKLCVIIKPLLKSQDETPRNPRAVIKVKFIILAIKKPLKSHLGRVMIRKRLIHTLLDENQVEQSQRCHFVCILFGTFQASTVTLVIAKKIVQRNFALGSSFLVRALSVNIFSLIYLEIFHISAMNCLCLSQRDKC